MTSTTEPRPRNRIRIEEFTANPDGDPAGELAYLRVNEKGHVPAEGDIVAIRTDGDPDYAVIRVQIVTDLGGTDDERHFACDVVQRTPRVETDEEFEPETIRPPFFVPTVDLAEFRGGDVERIAGIALERLTRIAALGGDRSEDELALVEAYSEIVSNAAPSMSSAMLDHFWNSVRDVVGVTPGSITPAPERTVRRRVDGEERERHFALANLN